MGAIPSNTGVVYALILTTLAGLSTGIGGLVIWKAKKTNRRLLVAGLGFSAGSMIYVSFMELMAEAGRYLEETYTATKSSAIAGIGFFAGIFFILIIDKFVPEQENPHEMPDYEVTNKACASTQISQREAGGLAKTGAMAALAVAIHNFPEGMATFVSAIADPRLGVTIAIAIAIHNIPEGISIALPVYYSTGSKPRAFLVALFSGLAEPLGALLAYLFLMPFFTPAMLGIIFSIVSGIMVFISIDVLLPSAEKYGEHHVAIYGVIAGMAVMAVSLVLL